MTKIHLQFCPAGLNHAKPPPRLTLVLSCPICAKQLDTIRQREGVFYHCAVCTGRALTIPQLRRVAGDRFATKVLRLLKLTRRGSEHACPFCTQRMMVLNVTEPALELEGCPACNVVWFDAPTYDAVPEGAAEATNSLPSLANEIFAENRLKEHNERVLREEAERKKSRIKGPRDL